MIFILFSKRYYHFKIWIFCKREFAFTFFIRHITNNLNSMNFSKSKFSSSSNHLQFQLDTCYCELYSAMFWKRIIKNVTRLFNSFFEFHDEYFTTIIALALLVWIICILFAKIDLLFVDIKLMSKMQRREKEITRIKSFNCDFASNVEIMRRFVKENTNDIF